MEKFNLTTKDFIEYDGNTWIYVNGKKLRRYKADLFPELLGFNTTREEQGKSYSELLKEGMKGVCCAFFVVFVLYSKGGGGVTSPEIDMGGRLQPPHQGIR